MKTLSFPTAMPMFARREYVRNLRKMREILASGVNLEMIECLKDHNFWAINFYLSK